MTASFVVYALFLALLAYASWVDLRTLRIPDIISVALFMLWLAWRLAVHFLGIDSPITFSDGIVAAVALGGSLLLLTTLFEAATHKRAMGGGDIKLLTMVGLFLGIEGGLLCLFVSCAASVLLSAILPSLGWKAPKNEEEVATSNDVDGDGIPDLAKPMLLKSVPFGPAIGVGAFVAVLELLFL